MKINAAITSKPFKNLHRKKNTISYDNSLIFIAIVFSVGILFGVLIFSFSKSLFISTLLNIFTKFSTAVNGKTFIEISSGFMFTNFLFGLCLIFAGTSMYAEIIVYPIILFKSAGIGAISAYLIENFQSTGLGYYFLCFLPGKILFSFGLLFLTQSSIQTSKKIKNSLKNCINNAIDLRLFFIRSALSEFIFIISSLIDATTLKMFKNFFNLPF